MASFATKIIDFHKGLRLTKSLPKGIKVLNPFKDNGEALSTLNTFYRKFLGFINWLPSFKR